MGKSMSWIRKMEVLTQRKQTLLEQGRALEQSHDELILERAAILAQGQSRLGHQPELEYFKMLGLVKEQAQQHPDLLDMLHQVYSLVAQIEAQEVQPDQRGSSRKPLDTLLEDTLTQVGQVGSIGVWDAGPPCISTEGQLEGGPKKGGKRASRQRPAPYPIGAKDENDTWKQSFTATDLGLEGQSAREYDSQADGGQQLP